MREGTDSKDLPTTKGKNSTKKAYILEYHKNNPWATAFEIARRINTTRSYVWKVLSNARKPSKEIRGRNGRIFAHGKVYYEWFVMPSSFESLNAPVANFRTGMKQIGSLEQRDPCSCQIHANGHLIIWARSNGWRDWLVGALTSCGWKKELSHLVVEQARLNVSVVEGGVKPLDPSFLPKDFYFETEWGAVLVRDDTPEKGVLELKLSIPDLQRYLGLPDIKKRLEVIEQGSLTHSQSQKAIEALLISLHRLLESQGRIPDETKEDRDC